MATHRKNWVLCEAALETSTNDDIKSFAKRMAKDHSSTNHKLMKIAEVTIIALWMACAVLAPR